MQSSECPNTKSFRLKPVLWITSLAANINHVKASSQSQLTETSVSDYTPRHPDIENDTVCASRIVLYPELLQPICINIQEVMLDSWLLWIILGISRIQDFLSD